MKKLNLLVLLIVSICGLNSCNNVPIFNSKAPFVVEKIKKVNKSMARYYGSEKNSYYKIRTPKPSVILPIGLYNVGDTILINNKNNSEYGYMY